MVALFSLWSVLAVEHTSACIWIAIMRWHEKEHSYLHICVLHGVCIPNRTDFMSEHIKYHCQFIFHHHQYYVCLYFGCFVRGRMIGNKIHAHTNAPTTKWTNSTKIMNFLKLMCAKFSLRLQRKASHLNHFGVMEFNISPIHGMSLDGALTNSTTTASKFP